MNKKETSIGTIIIMMLILILLIAHVYYFFLRDGDSFYTRIMNYKEESSTHNNLCGITTNDVF